MRARIFLDDEEGPVGWNRSMDKDLRKAFTSWFITYRYHLGRWSYALQRVSGIVGTGYFLAHIVETGNIVGGFSIWDVPPVALAGNVWAATVRFLDNPIFDTGLIVIGFMVVFHAVNGVRLTLTEFGLLRGKPPRPDFPFEPNSFTITQRALFWSSIIFATAAAVYAFHVLFGV